MNREEHGELQRDLFTILDHVRKCYEFFPLCHRCIYSSNGKCTLSDEKPVEWFEHMLWLLEKIKEVRGE